MAEISGELGLCYDLVKRICNTFSKQGKKTPKLLRIVRYVFEVIDGRRYPRPAYKFQRGKNCAKPKPNPSEDTRRYRARKVAVSTTSVFDLGLNQKARMRGIRVSLTDRNTNASDSS